MTRQMIGRGQCPFRSQPMPISPLVWVRSVIEPDLFGPQIYTVSQKNIPDVFSYKWRKHCRIFIIFGRNIAKKANNQMMLYFSTSPN